MIAVNQVVVVNYTMRWLSSGELYQAAAGSIWISCTIAYFTGGHLVLGQTGFPRKMSPLGHILRHREQATTPPSIHYVYKQ